MADHSSLPSVNNVKARFEQMAADAVDSPPKRVNYSVTLPVNVADIRIREETRSMSVPTVNTISLSTPQSVKKQPPSAPPKPARLSQHGRAQSIAHPNEKLTISTSSSPINPTIITTPSTPIISNAHLTSIATPSPIPTNLSTTPISSNPPPLPQRSIPTYIPVEESISLMPPPPQTSIRNRDRSVTPPAPPPPRNKTPVEGSRSPVAPPTPPSRRSRTPVDPKSLEIPLNGLGLKSPQSNTPNPPTLPPRPMPFQQLSVDDHLESPYGKYQNHHEGFQSSSHPNLSLQPSHLAAPILPPRPVRSTSPHDSSFGKSLDSSSLTSTSIPTIPSQPPQAPQLPISNGIQPYPASQPQSQSQLDSQEPTSDSDVETEIYSISNNSNPNLSSEYSYYGCPDSSQASRRPPIFEGVLHSIPTSAKGESKKIFSSFGKIACVSGGSSTIVYDTQSGEQVWSLNHSDTRITSIGYKSDDGQILFLGTKDGQLWEVNLLDSINSITSKRSNTHLSPIVLINKNQETNEMWSLSEDGKLCVWINCDITTTPKSFRVTPNFKAFGVAGSTLWIGRNRQVFVYQPSSSNMQFLLTPRPILVAPPPTPIHPSPSSASLSSMNGYNKPPPSTTTTNSSNLIGDFTSATNLVNIPDQIFFSHDNGCISIYSVNQLSFIETINVSMHKISAICGVGNYLWIGLKNGTIIVCDVTTTPWTVRKEWKAHDSAVVKIECFDDIELSDGVLPVISCSLTESGVALWDGLLKHDWIELDLQNHDSEFSLPNDVLIQLITWNVGAAKPGDLTNHDENTIIESIRKENAEIIVFGFQELVELDNTSVTAKSMFSKRKKEKKESAVVTNSHISHQYKAWQERLNEFVTSSLPDKYRLVHSNNMVGLFTCIFMKESSCQSLRDVKSSYVKTGLGGLHGNKGGLAVRMVVDDSSICFVNCHLAAGQSGALQRNSDVETILETKFSNESDNTNFTSKGIFVNGGDGTMIMDHEICFFSGDLNYRINKHRQIAIKHIQDGSLDELLEHDQLGLQLKKNPGLRLRAFNEHQISFPPTYKFDVGTDNYDSSEKKRVPAWCDRIFYRGGLKVIPITYNSLSVRASDHKPVVGVYKVTLKTIDASRRKDVYKDSLLRWKDYLTRQL